MKKTTLILLIAVCFFNQVRADEGMWLLSMIGKNYEQMKAQGFKLTPEDIYNVNNASIKDAVVGLSNEGSPFWHFCSGGIVSNEGLFLTNHHCGYGKIQAHSTIDHDYLADGFWAKSKKEELANPGLCVEILYKMEDVSDKIIPFLTNEMSEKERAEKVAEISNEIIKQAEEGSYNKAQVTDMFNGNQYFLLVYTIYKDVRLVAAPPSSMGKFGGDTDNWMWPRHTDDFSMFRIYTAPDGSPANYSEENIPLKPKHFFPVSAKELKNGDFAMTLGFPGTTDRFITSFGLEETMNITNKLRHEIRDVKINVLRAEMAADQATRIKYASKYASCSNYWKYSDEQNKALKNLNTMAVKKDIEAKLIKFDPKYQDCLNIIEHAYKSRAPYRTAILYLSEGILSGTELPMFAYQCSGLIDVLKEGNQEKTDKLIQKLKTFSEAFYKDYNEETEKKLEKALLKYVQENIDQTYIPDFYNTINKKYKNSIDKYIDDIFKKSIFSTKEKFNAFIEKPDIKTLENDPMLILGSSAYSKYREVIVLQNQNNDELAKGKRLFVEALLKMNPNTNYAPDANSTIRLSYGNVKSYEPRDGVEYNYYTTIEGVMQKENPNNSEFIVPENLKKLYEKKDYGNYTNSNGELVTCFISNNDITGGNSGSPVINGNGELIGLAFDGNSEAMSGDIDFEENLQRCISVDTRYVLFTIDKFAGATNLINEMKIVR